MNIVLPSQLNNPCGNLYMIVESNQKVLSVWIFLFVNISQCPYFFHTSKQLVDGSMNRQSWRRGWRLFKHCTWLSAIYKKCVDCLVWEWHKSQWLCNRVICSEEVLRPLTSLIQVTLSRGLDEKAKLEAGPYSFQPHTLSRMWKHVM